MSSRPDFLRIKQGFTLLELMIVIAVSAVVFGLTIPTAMRFYQNQLVDDAARTLKDALWRARTYARASRNDSPYGVKILPGSFVLFEGASYATRTPSEDEVLQYPSNLSVTGTMQEVTFSEVYATSTASGTIQIVGDGVSAVVGVNSYGKIEMQ